MIKEAPVKTPRPADAGTPVPDRTRETDKPAETAPGNSLRSFIQDSPCSRRMDSFLRMIGKYL